MLWINYNKSRITFNLNFKTTFKRYFTLIPIVSTRCDGLHIILVIGHDSLLLVMILLVSLMTELLDCGWGLIRVICIFVWTYSHGHVVGHRCVLMWISGLTRCSKFAQFLLFEQNHCVFYQCPWRSKITYKLKKEENEKYRFYCVLLNQFRVC